MTVHYLPDTGGFGMSPLSALCMCWVLGEVIYNNLVPFDIEGDVRGGKYGRTNT